MRKLRTLRKIEKFGTVGKREKSKNVVRDGIEIEEFGKVGNGEKSISIDFVSVPECWYGEMCRPEDPLFAAWSGRELEQHVRDLRGLFVKLAAVVWRVEVAAVVVLEPVVMAALVVVVAPVTDDTGKMVVFGSVRCPFVRHLIL